MSKDTVCAQNPDEIFDIVDENDTVVSSGKKSYIHKNKLLHRAVHAIFFDRKGRILLQTRSALKDSYPLCYTTSCSGHVDSGESYEQALLRETFEELGVKLKLSDFKKIAKLGACAETGFEFIELFTTVYEGEFNVAKDEVDSVEWMAPEDFEELIKSNPQKVTPSFVKVYYCAKENSEGAK